MIRNTKFLLFLLLSTFLLCQVVRSQDDSSTNEDVGEETFDDIELGDEDGLLNETLSDEDVDDDADFDKRAVNGTVTKTKCPALKPCAAGCTKMKNSRGCDFCYCHRDCRWTGCPNGYYCRRSPLLTLPAYTCVRRLRCPAISRPLVPQRNVCLRCQTNCNCLKCPPGYLCCRDWYGCVKCVRGIPY